MSAEPIDPRQMRVSDAEREHVVDLLRRATGAGSIDLDEFTERVDAALAARTRAELNVVLLDLPGLSHPDAHRTAAPPARRPGAAPVPVGDAGGAEVRSLFSGVTRRGVWDVPETLSVRATMGSVELDFSEAHIPHDPVHIRLDVVAGSVELRLPHGSRVVTEGVDSVMSSVEDNRRSPVGEGGPTFVLTGAVRVGSVEIRSPRRTRWWSSRK